jgi:hypothetical protein
MQRLNRMYLGRIGLLLFSLWLIPAPLAARPVMQTTLYPTEVRAIRVLQNVNVRSGPGTQYERLGRYTEGQVVDVFGTNAAGSWWNVRCLDGSVGDCWVTGATDTTQPTAPPPTPVSPIRIQFQPGGTSATVRGHAAPSTPVVYSLRALAGQQMSVQISSPDNRANFAVASADGTPYKRFTHENRSFSFILPKTQDYTIIVVSNTRAVDFSLTVSVVTPTPAPPAAPIRIRFPAGGTSATVNGLVGPSQQPRYVLRAMAGQEMSVQIIAPGNLANFAVTGADGTPYKRLASESRYFSFTLPKTQDYEISVASAGGTVDFSLMVTIRWPSSPPTNEPIRLQFRPGAISAEVMGSLPNQGRQDYLLRAVAGQEMTVNVYADRGTALLAITGTDGTPYKRSSVGGPSFRFTLPATQDYELGVIASSGPVSYRLVVTIE